MSSLPPSLARDTALFLDFDGTLAALQDDPQTVHLPERGEEILERLAAELEGALAIVTGRDIRDISTRVPTSLWRVGNHGLAVAPAHEAAPGLPEAPTAIRAAGRAAAALAPELWLEEKGPVVSLHHRDRPDLAAEVARLMGGAAAPHTDYKLEQGKGITELKPGGADKGFAIRKLMDLEPFRGRRPVFLGDDTTDEAGFETVLELGGVSVKVGEGETMATARLGDPAEVWRWLESAVDGFS